MATSVPFKLQKVQLIHQILQQNWIGGESNANLTCIFVQSSLPLFCFDAHKSRTRRQVGAALILAPTVQENKMLQKNSKTYSFLTFTLLRIRSRMRMMRRTGRIRTGRRRRRTRTRTRTTRRTGTRKRAKRRRETGRRRRMTKRRRRSRLLKKLSSQSKNKSCLDLSSRWVWFFQAISVWCPSASPQKVFVITEDTWTVGWQ